VDTVDRLGPPHWAIGATLPSFAVSFTLAGLLSLLRRSSAGEASPA